MPQSVHIHKRMNAKNVAGLLIRPINRCQCGNKLLPNKTTLSGDVYKANRILQGAPRMHGSTVDK